MLNLYFLGKARKMTISQRIFEILDEKKMTQKEFSQQTGIPQSTISDWRKKNTNPTSDKILIICEVLGITPYELLSGVKEEGNRSREQRCMLVFDESEEGRVLQMFNQLDLGGRARLLGYLEALSHTIK